MSVESDPDFNHKRPYITKVAGKAKKRKYGTNPAARRTIANVLIENELLIDEIKQRKELWVRSHPAYHQHNLTYPIWQDVAKNMDLSFEIVKTRWKSLKDHYRRELKKKMENPDGPDSKWPYFHRLMFMKSQMFLSLKRPNTEEHLEILTDDEEEVQADARSEISYEPYHAHKQEQIDVSDQEYDVNDYENGDVDYGHQMLSVSEVEEIDGSTHDGIGEDSHESDNQQNGLEEGEIPQIIIRPSGNGNDLSGKKLTSILKHSTITNKDPIKMAGSQVRVANLESKTAAARPRLILPKMPGVQPVDNIQNRLSLILQKPGQLCTLGNIDKQVPGTPPPEQQNQERMQVPEMTLHDIGTISNSSRRSTNVSSTELDDTGARVSPHLSEERRTDDDYHFFMSLIPHVRNFNSIQKLKLRARITQIIIEESQTFQYDPLGNC